MDTAKVNCLFLMPSALDRHCLESYNNQYNFFWATSNIQVCNGVCGDLSELFNNFDVVQYVQSCVQMVKDNGISIVIATGDYSSLLAAAVCEETGLPGTSVESQFLCYHKYYSRLTEGDDCSLWFDYISLPESTDKATWRNKVRYPCRVKPPSLFGSMHQRTVHNEEEMVETLATLRNVLPPWYSLLRAEFLNKYMDLSKYPLATAQIVIIEEVVDNEGATQHTVECWVDGNGNPHIIALSDSTIVSHPTPHNYQYYVPSIKPQEVVDKINEYVLNMLPKFKLKRTCINVELWCRGYDDFQLVEVNGRIAFVYEKMYMSVYSLSIYGVLLRVANTGQLTDQKEKNRINLPNGFAGCFHIQIYQQGRSADIVNFNALRKTSWDELDAFDQIGIPGVTLSTNEEDTIEAIETSGKWIGLFYTTGRTYDEMIEKAEKIRSILLFR